MWSTGSEKRVGPQASWGPGVPTPGCLRQRGSKATTRADRPPEWQNRGTRVPDPGCLALRAHRAVPLLTTSGVLGSPLWLFEHLLANEEGTQGATYHGQGDRPPVRPCRNHSALKVELKVELRLQPKIGRLAHRLKPLSGTGHCKTKKGKRETRF